MGSDTRGSRPVMLTADGMTKRFGATLANDDVSLTVRGGEVVGLVGENGAGKSTLLSILAGFLQPDAGSLMIHGQPVAFSSAAGALAAGIGLVHQHLSLVPSFTVREQLALAGWSDRSLPDLIAQEFDGDEVIEQLPLGRRQRIEIARALVSNPKVLLLDEPTSILAPSEVSGLFHLLASLRNDGLAIVVVTHKLHEVMTVADRIEVMAGGRVTGSFEREDRTWPPGTGQKILQRMFAWNETDGPAPPNAAPTPRKPVVPRAARPLLRLAGVSAPSMDGSRQLHDIGLSLFAGEFHAIVGIDGHGQSDLADVIAGHRRSIGTIELSGQDVSTRTPIERATQGLALMTDDRLGEGAIGSFSMAENLVLKRPRPRTHVRGGFFRSDRVVDHARSVIEAWGIAPADPSARFGSLSGGNMQRVLAAREVEREPVILIALNPVHGLDVVTADMLWRRFRSMCGQGVAVLVFTTDLDEALAQADQCAVMFDGRVSRFQAVDRETKLRYGDMMVNGW